MEDKISILKFVLNTNPLKLPQVLTRAEKVIVLFLLVVIIFCSTFLLRQYYATNTKLIPASGGTYVEGYLSGSSSVVSENITSLTHIGLTKLDQNGAIVPALAKSWQISPDAKTYTFTLQNGYTSKDLANYIRQQKGGWSNVTIVDTNPHVLQLNLSQPFGLFLASTLRPIFPYGPYKQTSQDANEITLDASNSAVVKPYISKIVFRLYSSSSTLASDLSRGKITATAETIPNPNSDYQKYSISLPRYTVAFFNTAKAPLADKATRQKLATGQTFSPAIRMSLLRPNTDAATKFTAALKAKWAKQGVTIDEKVANSVTILTDQIPAHSYDILVYGINTGYYNDPYPYWHSSQKQSSGMNFSQVSNPALDKLIEDGRLTLDAKVRQDKFTQVQNYIQTEYLAIYDSPAPFTFYVSHDVKGINIKFAVISSDRFTFANKWYIKTRRVHK